MASIALSHILSKQNWTERLASPMDHNSEIHQPPSIGRHPS